MQEDNVLPNDGTYFFPSEPKEQSIDRKRESAEKADKKNILNDLLERWDEKIKFYDSTTSISDEVKLDPQKLAIVLVAYSEVTEVLQAERQYIQSLIR